MNEVKLENLGVTFSFEYMWEYACCLFGVLLVVCVAYLLLRVIEQKMTPYGYGVAWVFFKEPFDPTKQPVSPPNMPLNVASNPKKAKRWDQEYKMRLLDQHEQRGKITGIVCVVEEDDDYIKYTYVGDGDYVGETV